MNMRDVKTLFDYNYWATTRVLEAAEHIGTDLFVAPLSSQTPTLRDVLMHIMSAERLWCVRWEIGSSPDALHAEAFPIHFWWAASQHNS